MKISLGEFEQQIDETILKRGLQYYKKGYVTNVDERGNGEYEALVEGSEEYTVNLSIKKGIVEDYTCTCPYDMGPVCKHVVATLFYLQKENMDVAEIPVSEKRTTGSHSRIKKQSSTEQVDNILMAVPEEELKDFIRQTCKRDKELRSRLLRMFANVNAPASASKAFYIGQIQDLIEVYAGRYGDIEYRQTREFGMAISEMLGNAERNIESGKYEEALPVIFAVLEAVTPVLNSSDDSDGYIGGCIDEAIELIGKLIEENINEALHNELFDYLMSSYKSNKLEGWDWHFTLLSFAICLLKTAQEKEQIKAVIASIKPTGEEWDWNYSRAQKLMLELLSKTEDEVAVTQYLKDNISNSDFREELIEQAIKSKDYKYALKLTNEGLNQDDKRLRGVADKWREYQLDIYKKIGDKDNIIRLAYHFVISESSHSYSLKYYYDLLKRMIPASSWQEYLEKNIIEVLRKSKWLDYSKLTSFYVWEEQWDKYLELLKKDASLQRIETAEKYLSSLYFDQLISLYDVEIRSFIKNNVGRSYYTDSCRYIRRMKELGGKQIADKLIEDMKAQYKNRRALLEELNKV